MIIKAALLAATLLAAGEGGLQATQERDSEPVAAPAPAPVARVPTAAQREEALALTTHPFVLGTWKVEEPQRSLMRCVQVLSGTRTDVETGQTEQISKIGNRCSFPIRFIGEVGKSDASRTVCVAELRVKTVMLPFEEYDIPLVKGGDCFRDVEFLGAEAGE